MSENLYYCDTASDPDNWQCKPLSQSPVPSSLKDPKKTHIIIISIFSVLGGIGIILIIYFLLCLAKKK